MPMVDVASEELHERRCMLKGIHPLMKKWYEKEETKNALGHKFGPYPLFWQDLENWSHTKTLQKIYLSVTEKLERGGMEVNLEAIANEIINGNDSITVEQTDETEIVVPEISSAENTSQLAGGGAVGSKKKRNRWGAAADGTDSELPSNGANGAVAPPTLTVPTAESNGDDTQTRVRRSRFSANVESVAVPTGVSSLLGNVTFPVRAVESNLSPQEILQQSLVLKMRLQSLGEKLITVVADAARIDADPNRSPSPPPKYDTLGRRTNTRDVRMREAYMAERTSVIEELMKLNPTYIPPVDYVRPKPVRRIMIPATTNPDHNLIGIIIGPRGNTQKELEQKTGCKISIRGKGSLREGSRGRANKAIMDEEYDLHVHVTGDDEGRVEMACKIIDGLLSSADDELNEHKQKQLRELALINGTLKEEEFCPICGEKGHRQWECPLRVKTFKAAGVKCSICGDCSHPTRDCPLKQNGNADNQVLDTEYDSFMAELDGKKATNPSSSSVTADSAAMPSSASFLPSTQSPADYNGNVGKGNEDAVPVFDSATGTWEYKKKAQTVIHVTTVLTGLAPPSTVSTNVVAASTSNSAPVVYTYDYFGASSASTADATQQDTPLVAASTTVETTTTTAGGVTPAVPTAMVGSSPGYGYASDPAAYHLYYQQTVAAAAAYGQQAYGQPTYYDPYQYQYHYYQQQQAPGMFPQGTMGMAPMPAPPVVPPPPPMPPQ